MLKSNFKRNYKQYYESFKNDWKVGIRQIIMSLMGWATHVLQWVFNNLKQIGDYEQNSKITPSMNCSLKLSCMKEESQVIVDHHATVNL